VATRIRSSLRGDLAGGIAGGIVTIPSSIGYGILALGSLGDAFIGPAILAGLYSAVVVSLVVILLGQRTTTAFAPRSIITVLFATIVIDTVVPAARQDPGNVERTLALVALIVVVAGVFQALFGILRVGNVIRYIPSPVMAGFQNAVAILLLLAQVRVLLDTRQPLTLAVGLLTVLVIWYGPRFVPRVPAPVAGLAAGTALYHALALAGLHGHLGTLLGSIPAAVPSFASVATLPALVQDAYLRAHWPSFFAAAVSLAVVASLDALLCTKTVEGLTGHRAPASPQLVRIGLANVAAGLTGTIPGGVNLSASFAVHRAGGRTGVAALICALLVLAAVLGLGPVIALIPRAAVAGVLIVVAVQLADRATLARLLRLFWRRDRQWWVPVLDLAVMVIVAVVTIVLDLVWAVSIGVAISILLFLYRMSRSLVRRSYRADTARSKRMREPRLMEFLASAGRRIVVFELEGPIFFGTAEKLAREIETEATADVAFVILDLRRVKELDGTGASILAQTATRLRTEGRHLLVSHLEDNALAVGAVRDAGLSLTQETVFADTDAALEWAEDRLITTQQGLGASAAELVIGDIPVLAGLSDADKALIAERLCRADYGPGDVVIRQGDTDRSLFIVAKGTTTVRVNVEGNGRQVRLASYSRGTVFGEMALLDRQPRSATVIADDDVVCYVLSEDAFNALIAERPLIAVHLLANLARELSFRLRNATRMISELER
jgi:MFS superfamily sulfate permease-like transporter